MQWACNRPRLQAADEYASRQRLEIGDWLRVRDDRCARSPGASPIQATPRSRSNHRSRSAFSRRSVSGSIKSSWVRRGKLRRMTLIQASRHLKMLLDKRRPS